MKAFEAKKQTSQAQYERIMKKINNSIKEGKKDLRIKYSEEMSEKVIKKIARDGFDIVINVRSYHIYSNTMLISWKNAKEGRIGSITKEVDPATTFIPEKKSFLERLFGDCYGEGDGDWC